MDENREEEGKNREKERGINPEKREKERNN